MLISTPCVVGLTWRLEDSQGQLIDELDAPVEFFVGGEDLLAKVEEALIGQAAGFVSELHLEPKEAFGDYQAELVFFESRSLFPDPIKAGMQFETLPQGIQTPGLPADAVYTVTEVYPNHVVLDGNHALAGISLRLSLQVHAVRPAKAEEIEAGSVTGLELAVIEGATAQTQLH